MLKTILRAPGDNFTFSLFTALLSNVKSDYEAYYIWTCPPDRFTQFFEKTTFTKPLVILGIKDLLDMWGSFNHWKDTIQPGSQLLIDVAARYPDSNFIIFTSNEHLNKEINVPNIHIVNWGGDITNHSTVYPNLLPVIDKNFNSTKPFISLNRNARLHRILLLSYLFGNDYAKFGTCSLLSRDWFGNDELMDMLPWKFEDRHSDAREKLIIGYRQIYKNPALCIDDYQIYRNNNNDNVTNFKTKLRSRYVDSFVEFVTESSFAAPAFMLTEKTLNSIYGCNFPILLSGVGAVAHLRELGFDMFDDVVDHSYDLLPNPIDRIIAAVDDNSRLITDIQYIKEKWICATDRFLFNVSVAKDIYTWYNKRAHAQFNNLILKGDLQ